MHQEVPYKRDRALSTVVIRMSFDVGLYYYLTLCTTRVMRVRHLRSFRSLAAWPGCRPGSTLRWPQLLWPVGRYNQTASFTRNYYVRLYGWGRLKLMNFWLASEYATLIPYFGSWLLWMAVSTYVRAGLATVIVTLINCGCCCHVEPTDLARIPLAHSLARRAVSKVNLVSIMAYSIARVRFATSRQCHIGSLRQNAIVYHN